MQKLPFSLQKDLVFAENGGETLRLDVHTPRGEGPFPVAIVLHGGGWSGGDKAGDTMELCAALQEAGFLAVAPNYRLAPAHRWPACGQDVGTAVEWAKSNVARLNGDVQRLALIGYSAGGHLAAWAALQKPEKVSAVVLLAAPTDLLADTRRRGELSPSMRALLDVETLSPAVENRLVAVSPINYVRAGLPPFLLLHGTSDQSVPFAQSLALRDKLREMGGDCQLKTLEGAPHRLADWAQCEPHYVSLITNWLHETLGDYLESASDSYLTV